MASKRMFSLTVADTDLFLDMPSSSQALYFHLGLRADDDGFVASPKKIAKICGCGDDDLRILVSKRFILPFESGIVVLTHWHLNNNRINVKKTLNNQIDSFVRLNDEYSTQEQKVESLRQKVAAYANQRIPTAEYKEITAQIEQAQEKLNRLNDAKERFGAIVLIITHWDQLKAAMSKLMDWIKGVFSVDWNAQLGVLGEGIEVLLSTVKGIFNSIKQICSGFITFLKGAFTGNIDMALKGVLGILRGVANLVFSIFKTPVNEVIALFNAMGQTIVKAINNLIDGLNHIKVPDWVPGIGGKGINLSHANFTRVPYLAQGAVIPAGNPFLAVLGDQTRGNNLEMPENLLRKIVSEESYKGTGMIKLVVNLDSRTVLEQLINTAKEMQMSNGQNVFELGR